MKPREPLILVPLLRRGFEVSESESTTLPKLREVFRRKFPMLLLVVSGPVSRAVVASEAVEFRERNLFASERPWTDTEIDFDGWVTRLTVGDLSKCGFTDPGVDVAGEAEAEPCLRALPRATRGDWREIFGEAADDFPKLSLLGVARSFVAFTERFSKAVVERA